MLQFFILLLCSFACCCAYGEPLVTKKSNSPPSKHTSKSAIESASESSTLNLSAFSGEMSAQQRRGQAIYFTGKSPSNKPIQARLNSSGALLPATLMPCVNCHLYNGKGTTEGGITTADIRWLTLTKPYGPGQDTPHIPYDRRSIKKAIAMGIGATGQSLNQVMPRYQLSLQDMDDLIAFLTGLGAYQTNGITESTIRIGVILPVENLQQSLAIKQALLAYFDELNQQGGIYQRQFKLIFIQSPAQKSQTALLNFKQALTKSNVFAFVASHLNGIEALMADFSQRSGIPVIGAFSPNPERTFPLNRYIFYLLSGQTRQTLALQSFAKQYKFTTQRSPPLATSAQATKSTEEIKSRILIENTEDFIQLRKYFNKQQNHSNVEVITLESIKPLAKITTQLTSQLQTLQQQKVELVYLLVSQPLRSAFFQQATRLNWRPNVLLPGSQFSNGLFNSPAAFDQRIFVAMPSLPFDYKTEGIRAYQLLKKKHKLSSKYRNSQLLALSSALLLKQGLIDTGRGMEQQKLVAKTESLYQFDTELTPLISYGPNRRQGASGAYVVTLDLLNKTIIPVSRWLEVK